MLENLCKIIYSQRETMIEIDKSIAQETSRLKQELGYHDIKDQVNKTKVEVKDWILENKNDLNFELITTHEDEAYEYSENVFDYSETYLDFDLSDNRYDTTYYLHLLDDKIVIYEEINEWETFDQRFNLVGLYVVTITK